MYAVIHLPDFELQARLRDQPELRDQPVALLDEVPTLKRQKDKRRIIQQTDTAARARVEAGMTAPQGLARCASLQILNRDPAREASAREALLQFAGGLSPRVESTAPGLCTIDLQGAARNRSDFQKLARRCLEGLARLQLHARVGIAANPDLARLAARFARPVHILGGDRKSIRQFLDPLPLSAIDPDHHTLKILHGWGIKTLGQLTALPREEVIQRLGRELLPLWQLAAGGSPRPLKLHQPARDFTEAADFEHRIEKLEALIFILNRFLDQLARRLAEVYLVAQSLTLELRFEDGSTFQRLFRIPDPTRDTRLLLRALHTFLENFTSKSPVTGVSLSATPARAVERQLDLFQASLRDPNQFAETIARLQALLGPDRVGRPVVEPSHRPDAIHLADFNPDHPTKPHPHPARLEGRARESTLSSKTETTPRFGPSLRRYRPALPVSVRVEPRRNGVLLLRIDSRELRGRVRSANGPWKHSGNWWDVNQSWQREEWDVELDQGEVIRLSKEDDQWTIDGLYD